MASPTVSDVQPQLRQPIFTPCRQCGADLLREDAWCALCGAIQTGHGT